MKPLGEANLTVKNPSTGDERIITLIVVPNGHANLLGFKTVQNMGRTSQSLTFITAVTFLSTLASTTDIDFSETASIAFN
jgi:hypothetical protein